jgi:hypothetical protein
MRTEYVETRVPASCRLSPTDPGMMVHRNTRVCIKKIEQEHGLGTNITVYARIVSAYS